MGNIEQNGPEKGDSGHRKGITTKQYKITGAILVGIAILLICVAIGVLIYFASRILDRSGSFIQPSPVYSGGTRYYDSFLVQMSDRTDTDLPEAVALKYYWSGDPKDKFIRPEILNNGQIKITSVGYRESLYSGPYPLAYHSFEIALPLEKSFPGFRSNTFYIEDPKDHLDEYGITPGTKVIFDEIEFHVIIHSDIQHVCIGYDSNGFPAPSDKMLNHFLVVENDDGSITFYRYYLFFECSEDNERFYADEDGILHVKDNSDGALVEVDRSLYKALDDFEPFEMICEEPGSESKPKPEKKQVEDFLLSISPEDQKICAEEYYLYDYPEDMEIVPVLSPKKEMTIRGLGGTQGEEEIFFRIIPPESKTFKGYVPGDGDPRDHLDEYGIEPGTKVIFDEVEFTIVMNQNIAQVKLPPADNENIYMAMENEDGSITFYRCFIRFDCSKADVKYYMSNYTDEDGVLFIKEGKVPVDIDPGWYKSKNTDFETFEMIYEGPSEQETGAAESETGASELETATAE